LILLATSSSVPPFTDTTNRELLAGIRTTHLLGLTDKAENCPLLSYYAASMANLYRQFGTTPLSHLWGSRPIFKNSWPLKMGPIGRPETSVKNKHYPLHNSSGELSSHLLHGGSFKSRKPRRLFLLVKNTFLRTSKLEFFVLVVFSSYEQLYRTTMWGGFLQSWMILDD
jgi:hypothetical protein